MARSKKKKWKSRIKKALKLAAIGAAGYGASKRFGGSKGNVLKTAASEDANLPDKSFSTARRLMTQPRAYNTRAPIYPDPIMHSGAGTKLAPEGRSLGSYWPFKKGGRVTGIAKRGFGRALMKGKK